MIDFNTAPNMKPMTYSLLFISSVKLSTHMRSNLQSLSLLLRATPIKLALGDGEAIHPNVFTKNTVPHVLEYQADGMRLPCTRLVLLSLDCLLMDVLQAFQVEAPRSRLYPFPGGKEL